MRKSFMYGLVMSVSLFSIPAFADPVADASDSAVTTKGYVDAGLKYVYDAAKVDANTLHGDITNLQNTVGAPAAGNNPATGLVGDVADLQDIIGTPAAGNDPATGLIGDIADLQDDVDTLADDVDTLQTAVSGLQAVTKTYGNGVGIVVTPGATTSDPSTIDLDLPENATAGSYVYQIDSNGDGAWAKMEVEDTWDPGFLTTP